MSKENRQIWFAENGIKIQLIIGILFLFGFSMIFYSYQNKMVEEQTRLIGSLYLIDSEAARMTCNVLLQESNSQYSLKKLEKNAVLAQKKFGYENNSIKNKILKESIDYYIVLFFVVTLFLFLYTRLLVLIQKRHMKKFADLQIKLQKKLEELQQIKILNEKMEKLRIQAQDYVENIAHQLKTPLARLTLSLELMKKENLDERRNLCLSEIEQVKPLIEGILNLSRMENYRVKLKSNPMNILQILKDAIKKTGKEKQYHWKWENNDSDEILFYGDEIWLTQAFFNLYENAARYTNEKGEICTEIIREEMGITLKIHDQGGGIPNEVLQSVFQRFFTGNSQDLTRTGIGLNLAKSVIERHHGTLAVYNEKDGAVFSAYLPVYDLKYSKV